MSAHFADPRSNVLQLGLHDGMRIADLGAGSGHYAIAAAHAVGKDGHVYAVDVQEDILAHLRDSAHRAGVRTIDTIWGNLEKAGGTKLRDASVDGVIMSNVLFQLEDPKPAVAEARRIVKAGGKVLVIDW